MQFLRQNTAVMITVGPFYDKTTGVDIETGLTITNERITLTADTDAGSAPTNVLDNVTGATSGTANDLNYITGNDAGMMQLELAAADTNRVGRMTLSITDAANHVPVFMELFVLPQPIFDWLTGVIVPLPANVTTIAGSAVNTSSAQLGVNVVNAAGTAWGSGAITSGVFAADAITAAKLAADVTTEIQSGLSTAAELAKVPKSDGTSTWNATALAALQQEATDALNAYDPPTRTEATADKDEILAALALIDDFLDTEIAAILAAVDTEVGAIKTQTDKFVFTVANQVDANLQYVNNVAVLGDGASTPWGP